MELSGPYRRASTTAVGEIVRREGAGLERVQLQPETDSLDPVTIETAGASSRIA